MSLRPGQRDEKHRTFLGWKVRLDDRHGKSELGTDGLWYSSADWWTDKAKAKAARDSENARRAKDEPHAVLVPAFRPESRMRRALRELVDAVTPHPSALCDGGCNACLAFNKARELLEETS